MKILITADYFLPSTRASGPIRSLINFVKRFASTHQLYIVTRDRDPQASLSYPEIIPDQWNDVCGARVWYWNPNQPIKSVMRNLVDSVCPDWIYMNSLFSPLTRSTLRLVGMRDESGPSLLIAVRGELSPAALAIKPIRKRIYISGAKTVGLFRNVRFQASSASEQAFIGRWFPENQISVAMNLPEAIRIGPKRRPTGPCRFLFNSRIAPIKNLEVVLKAFEAIHRSQVDFDGLLEIHGTPSDAKYAEKIKAMIARCGKLATFCGPYKHDQIWDLLRPASFSVLPSHGENFAHAIYESAAAGVPFLISDRTPWTRVAQDGAGWVLDPDDLQGWTDTILDCYDLAAEQYLAASKKCVEAAEEVRELADQQHDMLFRCDSTQ